MIKNKTFRNGLIAAVLVVALLSLFDVFAAHSGVFGSFQEYTNGNYPSSWWSLYFKNAMILFGTVAISYYIFGRQDISESIAIFITPLILFEFGLSDILYFWFQGQMVPLTLPWLDGHNIIGRIADIFNFESVTNIVLYISAVIGLITAYFSAVLLEKVN